MRLLLILLSSLLVFLSPVNSIACENGKIGKENVAMVKTFLKDVIAGMNIKDLSKYYTEHSVNYVNNQIITFQDEVKIRGEMFKEIKKMEYHIEQIFPCGDDKVVLFINFNPVDKNGKSHWFRKIAIFSIKDHKIVRAWALFNPMEPYAKASTKIIGL